MVLAPVLALIHDAMTDVRYKDHCIKGDSSSSSRYNVSNTNGNMSSMVRSRILVRDRLYRKVLKVLR